MRPSCINLDEGQVSLTPSPDPFETIFETWQHTWSMSCKDNEKPSSWDMWKAHLLQQRILPQHTNLLGSLFDELLIPSPSHMSCPRPTLLAMLWGNPLLYCEFEALKRLHSSGRLVRYEPCTRHSCKMSTEGRREGSRCSMERIGARSAPSLRRTPSLASPSHGSSSSPSSAATTCMCRTLRASPSMRMTRTSAELTK